MGAYAKQLVEMRTDRGDLGDYLNMIQTAWRIEMFVPDNLKRKIAIKYQNGTTLVSGPTWLIAPIRQIKRLQE